MRRDFLSTDCTVLYLILFTPFLRLTYLLKAGRLNREIIKPVRSKVNENTSENNRKSANVMFELYLLCDSFYG